MNTPECLPQTQDATSTQSSSPSRVLPIDASVMQHVSPAYWDWRSLFDRDPCASPLQHPDFVIAELGASRSRMQPVLLRDGTDTECRSLGVLVPKTIRTSQVGGIGPGWTMHGLRLAGGRFFTADESLSDQAGLLVAAAQHCANVGASFLLIEDLDEATALHAAVSDESLHGCRRLTTHSCQPRRRIEFPSTEADYWGTFSSRSLSKFRRNLKKFGRTRLERVTEPKQLPDFLLAAHEISQQSWQSHRFGLRIRNDDAELRQLSALAEHGFLRSYVWWVEDKPAAFAVCNQHRGCFRYEEIAYRAEFAQFSPGRTMLMQIVGDLFQHDPPRTLDFGGGDAEYKQQFANRESRSGSVWLVPPTWQASFALTYLKCCRTARMFGRKIVKSSGLGTKARQWLRYGRPIAVPASPKVELQEATRDE